MRGLNSHPQARTPLCWSPALEAATHSLLILLGGSLKAEGFGDGFSLAKHIPCESRGPERKSWIPVPALGSRKAGSLAGMTTLRGNDKYCFRNGF